MEQQLRKRKPGHKKLVSMPHTKTVFLTWEVELQSIGTVSSEPSR